MNANMRAAPWAAFPVPIATAIIAWVTCCVVTIAVSSFTKPRPDEELVGLVYSLTERPTEVEQSWYQRPTTLAIVVLVMAVILNVILA